jgi:ubiquinone/menaquinone biosynthesis C-methylase UbiE
MVLSDPVRAYYEQNPLMVSSPFGGIDGVNRDLVFDVWRRLGVNVVGRAILDVGCGRGHIGEVVEEQGGMYTGVDFVASRAGFRLALADAVRLPFTDGAFDGVFCIDAFEHFPHPEQAAREFRRVLRPGGFVFLSVPNYGNVAGIVKWYCERYGRYEKDTWAPFRRWQPQELERPLTIRTVRRVFREGGFTDLRWIGHAGEAGLGLFPWMAHPKMPEAAMYRLQSIFGSMGESVVRLWPGASLHTFWKIEL